MLVGALILIGLHVIFSNKVITRPHKHVCPVNKWHLVSVAHFSESLIIRLRVNEVLSWERAVC